MSSTAQDMIVEFVSKELGIPRQDIDVDANLGVYGLESIAASKLIGTLERTFPSLQLSEVLVFEFPTIASLSAEIDRLAAQRASQKSVA